MKVYITQQGKKWILDVPSKQYTGAFNSLAKAKSFISAIGDVEVEIYSEKTLRRIKADKLTKKYKGNPPYGYGAHENPIREKRENYRGIPYDIWYTAPKGYKAVGIGPYKRIIASRYFDKYEQAQEHAEQEINGWLEGNENPKRRHTVARKRKKQSEAEKKAKRKARRLARKARAAKGLGPKVRKSRKTRVRKSKRSKRMKRELPDFASFKKSKKKKKKRGGGMNLNAVAGAIKSKKTPKHLKDGLLAKYGSQLKAAGLI